jgi:hypothetical protein
MAGHPLLARDTHARPHPCDDVDLPPSRPPPRLVATADPATTPEAEAAVTIARVTEGPVVL